MSVFYGKPYQGEFAQWSTRELKRDLESPSIDPATKIKIEGELVKRSSKKEQRRLMLTRAFSQVKG